MTASKSKGIKKLRGVDTITCYVATDSLKPAPWNPAIRVQLAYLHNLRDSMEADGFWEFMPILVDRNSTIIDGHRRWTAAKLLNLTEVPVTIVDADADEKWADINGTVMPITGAQALQAIASGMSSRPAKYEPMISKLEAAIGTDGLKMLGQRGKSPYVIHSALRIARYLGLEDNTAFVGQVVWWLSDHARMNMITSRAMNEDVPAEVIERAIRANRPLTANYR